MDVFEPVEEPLIGEELIDVDNSEILFSIEAEVIDNFLKQSEDVEELGKPSSVFESVEGGSDRKNLFLQTIRDLMPTPQLE